MNFHDAIKKVAEQRPMAEWTSTDWLSVKKLTDVPYYGLLVKTHRDRVIIELRKELLLDLIPNYISDDDLLKQAKGSFLMLKVKLRLVIQDLLKVIKDTLYGWLNRKS